MRSEAQGIAAFEPCRGSGEGLYVGGRVSERELGDGDGARSRWCRQRWGHGKELGFYSELPSHRLGQWCQSVYSLTSQTTRAHLCDIREAQSLCPSTVGRRCIYHERWWQGGHFHRAGTQDTVLSRPALNSWVCDKRQVLCLNVVVETFHRHTLCLSQA